MRSLPDLPIPACLRAAILFFMLRTMASLSPHWADFELLNGPPQGSGQVILPANESCWAGRPFVDEVDLTMGVNFDQQANAIAFSQADVVELPASQVRRAAQRGVRTVSSDPVELFALQFDSARPAVQDARVRQAISLAIDRASIADVILQRQGIVCGRLACRTGFRVTRTSSQSSTDLHARKRASGRNRPRSFSSGSPCADL